MDLRPILTVAQLTGLIKDCLEGGFPDVWVEGEISNFKPQPSGHTYFTLKDTSSSIRAVIFRSYARFLKFQPRDGDRVIVRGHLSVYEPRGEYQLVVDYLEPKGIGALQVAFEQLKERLKKEGLFDEARKRPIPCLPRRVGVVTSPSGAAVRDIITVLSRRFANIEVLIYPVRVQGEGAAAEIAGAIDYLNTRDDIDVLIVGRGGGSLEDLWAFNEEVVARAVALSRIPVISAVGHETDFTIADFVADLRAPTPSAAAEMVVKSKAEFAERLRGLESRLIMSAGSRIQLLRHRLAASRKAVVEPGRQVNFLVQRLDDLRARLLTGSVARVRREREALASLQRLIFLKMPAESVRVNQRRLTDCGRRLETALRYRLGLWRGGLEKAAATLDSLSPLATLGRGYAVARLVPSGVVLRDIRQVRSGDDVTLLLTNGELLCGVKEVRDGDEKKRLGAGK